jgi:hypothetical protein
VAAIAASVETSHTADLMAVRSAEKVCGVVNCSMESPAAMGRVGVRSIHGK